MTNRFTERAQRALNASLSAAADLGHTYIGSEHILLGLMADDASIAAKMLRAHGADRTRVREAVVNMAGEGVPSQVSPADMTPRTQKIIQESATLSVHAGQSYIGTEHLLLALLGEGDCVAVRRAGGRGTNAKPSSPAVGRGAARRTAARRRRLPARRRWHSTGAI